MMVLKGDVYLYHGNEAVIYRNAENIIASDGKIKFTDENKCKIVSILPYTVKENATT